LLNIPEGWSTLLKTIREVAPGAYLVGGALRDLDNGRPIKDLDVFVPYGSDLTALEDALRSTYPEFLGSCPGEYIDSCKEIAWTCRYGATLHGAVCSPELNIIVLAQGYVPEDLIRRVDFGLCQIGYDGEAVQWTEAYETDKANRTLTLTRAEDAAGFRRSMTRYQRLALKYNGWPLIVPEEFAHFVGPNVHSAVAL
jgi:hypothetical protein